MDIFWIRIMYFLYILYISLQLNSFNTTKDVMDVARAWATEFYRLKGKIFFDNKEVEKETLEFNKNLEEKQLNFILRCLNIMIVNIYLIMILEIIIMLKI